MYDIVDIFLKRDDVISLTMEGEPVFEAKTTAKAFGFEKPMKAIALNVDEHEFFYLTQDGKKMIFLRESGLYALAMVADSPEAKAFQKWLFSQQWFKQGANAVLDELLNE